jgi:sulfur carrier protein
MPETRAAAIQWQRSMRIVLNGDETTIPDAITIADLLARLEIDARRVAVERNFAVVKRDEYARTVLGDGDQVEIVNFVGGG